MKYCSHKGYLVNATYTLEPDMKAYDEREERLRGCSNLRCTECGSRVLHFDGKTQKRIYSLAEQKAMYHNNEFDEALEDYAPDPTRRLYMCACASSVISKYPENCMELLLDAGPFWMCDGHEN